MQQQVLEFLQMVRNGEFLVELGDALQLARDAEQKQQKPAEVTVKFRISPAAQGDSLPVFVEASVSTKLPAVEHGKTIFYAGTEGDALLTRNDPRQPSFDSLRVVGGAPASRPTSTDIAVGGRE